MSLHDDAVELSNILNQILQGLEQYHDSPYAISYTSQMAQTLAPIVAEYDEAVFNSHSRESAASALAVLKEYMHNVNGAATKGDIAFVANSVLNRYWDLQTIFQETRYRDSTL